MRDGLPERGRDPQGVPDTHEGEGGIELSRGVLISLEGIEGSGKSTHAKMLAEQIESRGLKCVLTAEPGGARVSQKIRELLLSVEYRGMDALTELLLYAAARREHLKELIIPSLDDGKVVVTDRFSDSTRAYQGTARGIEPTLIDEIDRMVTGGLKPDLTLLLDLDARTGLARNRQAGKLDRMELEELDFHEKVRAGFLDIQRAEPERVKLVDAGKSVREVQEEILKLSGPLLGKLSGRRPTG
jgi:dTMP kinase